MNTPSYPCIKRASIRSYQSGATSCGEGVQADEEPSPGAGGAQWGDRVGQPLLGAEFFGCRKCTFAPFPRNSVKTHFRKWVLLRNRMATNPNLRDASFSGRTLPPQPCQASLQQHQIQFFQTPLHRPRHQRHSVTEIPQTPLCLYVCYHR